MQTPEQRELDRQRGELLQRLEAGLETPMLVLAFAWLLLLVVELVWGLSPLLTRLGIAIWIAFIADFGLRLVLAPDRPRFLARNWLTLLSLVVPALRVFRALRVVRALRAARAVRGLRLLRVVTSLNRGMRALGASLSRIGFGYVIAATALVTVGGAAGMYAFEGGAGGGFRNYGDALWWTAMLLTSIGSEYWPQTPEGRFLCLLLGVYGFAVFGYLVATLATFFVGRDADRDDAELAGRRSLRDLELELVSLRDEIRALRATRPGG